MACTRIKIVTNCARCGKDHEDILFEELIRPVKDDNDVVLFTHWTACPTNGQPILNLIT